MKKVVLLGDSIRMGYQPFVIEALKETALVWGPEGNCGPSQRIVDNADQWIADQQADVIHINCGLHDLRKEYGSDIAARSLEDYRKNVEFILQTAKKKTKAKVIWATTTPVNEEWHHDRKGFDRFEADVVAYNQAALEVVDALGIPVNDLFAYVMSQGCDSMLRNDGVHYPEEACRKLGIQVTLAIQKYL